MATSTARTYKPKRHIIVDIETLSTKRNAAIVDIAAVVADWNFPCKETFQTCVTASSQPEALFHVDSDTITFHHKNDPEFLNQCETQGLTFQEAAVNFVAWINSQADHGAELHFWSQGKDFDFPILENMFHAAGVNIPWRYSRLHCIRDLVWLNPSARIKDAGAVAHKALPDAIHEANQLIAVVNNSSWYQRLFK